MQRHQQLQPDAWATQQKHVQPGQCPNAGNSFRSYAKPSILRLRDEARPYHLFEVTSSSTAWELAISEVDYPVTSAFNDLSLHLFPEWKIATPNPPT